MNQRYLTDEAADARNAVLDFECNDCDYDGVADVVFVKTAMIVICPECNTEYRRDF